MAFADARSHLLPSALACTDAGRGTVKHNLAGSPRCAGASQPNLAEKAEIAEKAERARTSLNCAHTPLALQECSVGVRGVGICLINESCSLESSNLFRVIAEHIDHNQYRRDG